MIMSGEEREQESKPLICAFGKQNQLDPATQVNTLKVSQVQTGERSSAAKVKIICQHENPE